MRNATNNGEPEADYFGLLQLVKDIQRRQLPRRQAVMQCRADSPGAYLPSPNSDAYE